MARVEPDETRRVWFADENGEAPRPHEFVFYDYTKSKLAQSYVYRSKEKWNNFGTMVPRYYLHVSYKTDILVHDTLKDRRMRLWNRWSRTTAKHESQFRMKLDKLPGRTCGMSWDGEKCFHKKDIKSNLMRDFMGRKVGEWPEFTELYWNKSQSDNVHRRWIVTPRRLITREELEEVEYPKIDVFYYDTNWMIDKRSSNEPWSLLVRHSDDTCWKFVSNHRTFKLAREALRQEFEVLRVTRAIEGQQS